MNTKLAKRTGQLALAIISGYVVLGGALLLLLMVKPSNAQAAASIRPLIAILTGTTSITHTTNTTHEMRVFGDGRITNYFMTFDDGPPPGGTGGKRNQIDQAGDNPDATTIAVMFDQHIGNNGH